MKFISLVVLLSLAFLLLSCAASKYSVFIHDAFMHVDFENYDLNNIKRRSQYHFTALNGFEELESKIQKLPAINLPHWFEESWEIDSELIVIDFVSSTTYLFGDTTECQYTVLNTKSKTAICSELLYSEYLSFSKEYVVNNNIQPRFVNRLIKWLESLR